MWQKFLQLPYRKQIGHTKALLVDTDSKEEGLGEAQSPQMHLGTRQAGVVGNMKGILCEEK